MGLATFAGSQPTLKETVVAKNDLNEKELRAMGQLVSGYLGSIKLLDQKTDKK